MKIRTSKQDNGPGAIRSGQRTAPAAEVLPWADPAHPSNKLRPLVRCKGCGELGCVTTWGPWCFACNVERMTNLNKQFDELRKCLDKSDLTANHS